MVQDLLAQLVPINCMVILGKGLAWPSVAGHRSLGDDLVADESGHFQCQVRVGNPRLRGLEILGLE